MNSNKGEALLIVDVQNDFCPGGALAVPEGDAIVPVLNRYIAHFCKKGCPVLASRDWHPPTSRHFKTSGGPWSEHCIQNTRGAGFHPDLKLPNDTIVLSKGNDPDKDGYSVFEGIDNVHLDFASLLKDLSIQTLFVGGLATEYCVQATVLDALKKGFRVYLLTDAIKGIEREAAGKAIDTMVKAGAKKITIDELG